MNKKKDLNDIGLKVLGYDAEIAFYFVLLFNGKPVVVQTRDFKRYNSSDGVVYNFINVKPVFETLPSRLDAGYIYTKESDETDMVLPKTQYKYIAYCDIEDKNAEKFPNYTYFFRVFGYGRTSSEATWDCENNLETVKQLVKC